MFISVRLIASVMKSGRWLGSSSQHLSIMSSYTCCGQSFGFGSRCLSTVRAFFIYRRGTDKRMKRTKQKNKNKMYCKLGIHLHHQKLVGSSSVCRVHLHGRIFQTRELQSSKHHCTWRTCSPPDTREHTCQRTTVNYTPQYVQTQSTHQ